jgi:uncharacterized protein YjiS (DUF1127 family)
MSTHSVSPRAISSHPYVFLRAKTNKSSAEEPRLLRFLGLIREWQRRAQSRRELAHLSYFDIKDIGYPADLAAEKNRPFWRR